MGPKDVVYSWRLRRDLKDALVDVARSENTSLADLLESIARGWLARRATDSDDAQAQRRIHDAAKATFGAIRGSDPHRSEQASSRVRAELLRQHAR